MIEMSLAGGLLGFDTSHLTFAFNWLYMKWGKSTGGHAGPAGIQAKYTGILMTGFGVC